MCSPHVWRCCCHGYTSDPGVFQWTGTGRHCQHKQKQSGCSFLNTSCSPPLCHFIPLPPASLSLSSPPLKRHMALWHTAHSILTSYIPWNTSSPVSPRSWSLGPKADHSFHLLSHTLSSLHPPTLGLISRHQWLPLSFPIRVPRLSERFHPAPLLPLLVCSCTLVCAGQEDSTHQEDLN